MTVLPLGTAEIIKADSRDLPLPDNSVDLVVTSPPYFALRSYQDGGEHYDGQIGAEPTPDEFVTALLEVTRECMRVLKPSGSIWVNLGDKYAGDGRCTRPQGATGERITRKAAQNYVAHADRRQTPGIVAKSLMGMPWRYALRCIDELGLILRAEVVWSKPNGLPESVTDRVRRSHEQWFHFTLEPRYFSAVDEIREEHVRTWGAGNGGTRPALAGAGHQYDGLDQSAPNPLGKLPGSVWTIATEPLKVPAELGIDHFAAFPTEWPRRIINGWSPNGLCDECGQGRRPVSRKVEREPNDALSLATRGRTSTASGSHVGSTLGYAAETAERAITGYACACGTDPEWDTHPAVVLDPFGGTGTTALVAKALGRHGISVDMSTDYCRLAEWRTNDPKQIERVQNMQRYGIRNPTKKQIREFEEGAA